MRFAWVFFLGFLKFVFALTQDQIFQNDWQTVNIGTPHASVHRDGKIIALSELGIFSIINSTTGGVLYRYQSEVTPILTTSDLIEASNGYVISFLNFGQETTRSFKSKLIIWNLTKPYGTIEKEIGFLSNILTVLAKDDFIYVVDKHGIWVIDTQLDYKVNSLYFSEELITNAKLFHSDLDHSAYAVLEMKGKSYLSNLSDFIPKQFTGCSISELHFVQSSENLIMCAKSEVFAFDSYGYKKLKSGKNMINENVSADSLSAKAVSSFEVLNDRLFILSDQNVSLFNYNSFGLTADAEYQLPESFLYSTYHSFHGTSNSTDIDLLLVSPDMVIEYYRNGVLLWSNDQSFVAIEDFVILDQELKSSLTIDELIFESSSNILLSYIRRVRHNYNSLFGKLNTKLDEAHRFGMNKYIVALSQNGKVGIFAMYKNEKGEPQLKQIFVPPIKFTKLFNIDKKIYALHDKSIYEVDIYEGKIFQQTEEFVSFHFKVLHISEFESEFIQTSTEKFYTTSISKGSNVIRGHFWNNEQIETWKFSPKDEEIISLTKRSYGNEKVAQNAIVLPDRSSLYKYLIPNVGVATTRRVVNNSNFIIFYIINLITGQEYGRFEKEIDGSTLSDEVQVAFEENFIILTVPDKSSTLDTQICSIDMFEVLKPDQKLTASKVSTSAFDEPVLPAFASQCFLLPGTSIRGLSISRTRHNIASKDIILRTGLGRVIAFPKMIVDGRRNGLIGDFENTVNFETRSISLDEFDTSPLLPKISSSKYAASVASKFAYDPIININPQAILTHHRKLIVNDISGFSSLTTEPTELESTTYVISVDGDIFVTFLRPSSSFDRLTSSFNAKIVITTILVLLMGIVVVRPKIQKAKLSGRWAL